MKKAGVKTLTSEQEQIVQHIPLAGEIIVVNAYAGTGKTTTCKAVVNRHTSQRFLYLVFNSAMQKAVQKDFASCRTTHSLALEFTKSCFPNMLPPMGYIASHFRTSANLNHFFQTPLDHPTMEEAIVIWDEMKRGTRPFTHDAYLKYFCSHPRAADWVASQWDCVMIDEAQDTNAALAHFMLSIPAITLYLVGDPHQGIYKFRNAVNMMELAPPKALRFYLTQSFRFGAELGEFATVYIRLQKCIPNMPPIVGCAPHATIIHRSGTCPHPHVIISKTNAAGFRKALEVVKSGKKVFFAKGKDVIQGFRTVIEKYGNQKDLQEEMEDAQRKGDFELFFQLDMLALHKKERLIEMVDTVEKGLARTMKSAFATVMTCHASKGLEFDHVVINHDMTARSEDPQVQNLYYVGITRAKKSLYLA